MDKYNLPVCSAVFSDRAELPKTFEAALPDYCPGIMRIVKTDALFSETNASLESPYVVLRGKANVRVLYIAEGQGFLKSVSFPFDFEHTFDAAKMPEICAEAVIEAQAGALAVSAKPKGTRSMEIKLGLALNVNVYDCAQLPLLSPDSAADAELHAGFATAAVHIKLSAAPERLHEDITLEGGMAAIADIADSSAMLLLQELRAEDGALKFSGNAVFKCTYRAESAGDSSAAEYVYLTKEIPFEGEIADERLKRGMTVTGRILPADIETGSSFDPYGESRVIHVSIGYRMQCDAFDESEVGYFDDGYCAAYECDFEKNTYAYERLGGTVKDNAHMEERLHTDRSNLVEITDTSMALGAVSAEVSDGKLYANGKAGVWVLGSDEKGEPTCLQTVLALHLPIESVHDAASDRHYLINTQISSCSATLRDGEILLTADAATEGVMLEKCRLNAIDRADIHYDSPKPLCQAEYIVYYPERGETVWSIAKKYEIPQKKLREANNLTGADTTGDRRTIVIPCGQ